MQDCFQAKSSGFSSISFVIISSEQSVKFLNTAATDRYPSPRGAPVWCVGLLFGSDGGRGEDVMVLVEDLGWREGLDGRRKMRV